MSSVAQNRIFSVSIVFFSYRSFRFNLFLHVDELLVFIVELVL